MTKNEKLYTLKEAQRRLGERECDKVGHRWEIVERGDGEPSRIRCDRCGRSWPVGDEDQ